MQVADTEPGTDNSSHPLGHVSAMPQHARMLLLLPGGTSGGALPKLAFLPDSDNRSVSVTKAVLSNSGHLRSGWYHATGEHYYRQI